MLTIRGRVTIVCNVIGGGKASNRHSCGNVSDALKKKVACGAEYAEIAFVCQCGESRKCFSVDAAHPESYTHQSHAAKPDGGEAYSFLHQPADGKACHTERK